jgi:RNA polymerase sigma-70 factor, ECF subfamily
MDERTAAAQELRDLMARYQQGEVAALDELVRRISPSLLRYFAGSLSGRNDAEDLLQECWMQIHRSRHTYRSSEPLLPWIFAIARHTRLDGYRKWRRLQSRELLVAEIPENLHGTAPETAFGQDELDRLLGSLPETQREVILMLKVSGMSLSEVARATSSTGSGEEKGPLLPRDTSPCFAERSRRCPIIRTTMNLT